MSQLAVDVRNLVKRYGDLAAVDCISFSTPKGACLGVLGPNGAGKTTTVEILEGLRVADEGRVELLGLEWREGGQKLRERIGVQLQETRFADKLTVSETLSMFRGFYATGYSVDELVRLTGLQSKAKARVEHLSGGQLQRLALGCAIANKPDLLFLDEPSTGLDPQARRRIWELVEEFKSQGGSVVLTTHYMDEAERLADNLVIIDRGRIIARGTPKEIVDTLHADSVVELTPSAETRGRLPNLAAVPGVTQAQPYGDSFRLAVTDPARAIAAVIHAINEASVELVDLHTHRPNLEDVFVSLTGRQLRDD